MRINIRSFWAQKDGNEPKHYEDAFWPYWLHHSAAGREFRFAIADGATEAAFSRLWARLLVQRSCQSDTLLISSEHHDPPIDPTETIGKLARHWAKKVFYTSAKPLPWNVQEKALHGAFSTLLRLTMSPSPTGPGTQGVWTAFAVGDSCLFHLRSGLLETSWPIDKTSRFNNRPQLLATDPARNQKIRSNLSAHTVAGVWLSGDEFLLMTDAIAHWYLSSLETGTDPTSILPDVALRQDQFAEWLDTLRRQGDIRNDDVTLIRIQVTAES